MALTGTFAVTRRWIEGDLDTPADALRTFLYGGAGGYGFYQAKRLVGRRRTTAGMALAYASASVVENAAQGEHPLGFARFGPGQVDLRLRTPFGPPDAPRLDVQVNALGAFGAALALGFGSRPVLRGGTLFYRSPRPLGWRGQRLQRDGFAFGRTVVLGPLASGRTVAHEAIHFIQALQAGAVTPYYTLGALFEPERERALFGRRAVTWNVQLDWLYGVLAGVSALAPYQHRWAEVEAYSLER